VEFNRTQQHNGHFQYQSHDSYALITVHFSSDDSRLQACISMHLKCNISYISCRGQYLTQSAASGTDAPAASDDARYGGDAGNY